MSSKFFRNNQKRKVAAKPAPKKVRPLTPAERMLSLQATVTVQYMIDTLERIQQTDLYSASLKSHAKNFKAALLQHAGGIWSSTPEGSDSIGAMEQLINLVEMFHNLMTITLAIDYVSAEKQKAFFAELNNQFEKFDIPLVLKDGILLLSHEPVEETMQEGGEQA